MTLKFTWKCPKCGAPPNGHGKGGEDKCEARGGSDCMGFICECEEDSKDHGTTLEEPCENANCYHCGWGGTFPQKPKGLQKWEEQALKAGWTPPVARQKELKAMGGKK